MASQDPHNPRSGYSSGQVPGQAQMRRNDLVDQPSHHIQQNQDHETSFLQETGTQVTNMAQGAAEIGKGAALGAISMAKGAATGAANLAHGAADAVKHTFGMDTNAADNTTNWGPSSNTANYPGGNTNRPSHVTNTNHPGNTNCPTNTTASNLADTTNYPINLMDDPAQDAVWPSHHNNPSSRKNI